MVHVYIYSGTMGQLNQRIDQQRRNKDAKRPQINKITKTKHLNVEKDADKNKKT